MEQKDITIIILVGLIALVFSFIGAYTMLNSESGNETIEMANNATNITTNITNESVTNEESNTASQNYNGETLEWEGTHPSGETIRRYDTGRTDVDGSPIKRSVVIHPDGSEGAEMFVSGRGWIGGERFGEG